MATKWGICGTGKIGHDFCNCLANLPNTDHQIVAVAAGSSISKAQEFAKSYNVPAAYGSYAELAKDENVDVVYVNCIHTLHVETCLMMIEAGKSVLCEKPMALSLEGCKKVLAAAKDKGVLFVEAYWSRFFPCYKFIKETIDAGVIGEVKMVEASFCVPMYDVPRIKELKLGGGGLMDIGCYVIQAANFIFKGMPEQILSDGAVCETNGIDKCGIITLRYSGGRYASLRYSVETKAGNSNFIIRGTDGNIEVPDTFWSPTRAVLNGEPKNFPLPSLKSGCNYANSEGLTYEAECVRQCLLKGLKECPHVLHADSEIIMTVMQQVLDKFNIKYHTL